MNRGALSISIVFLLVALTGGLVLVFDLSRRYGPEGVTAEIPPQVGTIVLPTPTLDGTLAEGEYAHHHRDEETGIDLYWTILGEDIYVGLRSPGHGWVALGLDPDGPLMRGADIVIGYVRDGEAVAEDHYADEQVGHKHDSELGGTDDLRKFAGSEDEKGTTLEFVRPLKTDDPYDKEIRTGEMFIMLAYSPTDDNFVRYHGNKNRSTRFVDFFAEAPAAAKAKAVPPSAGAPSTGAEAEKVRTPAEKPQGPPTLDGTLAEGEYAAVYRDESTGIELHWTIVDGKIYLGLRSPGSGWVAVGFAPEGPMMRGADILIGYVKDGEAFVEDGYADAQVSHKPDTELGGTNDIEEFAGSEGPQGTVIELVRPLSTDDSYDHPISPETVKLLLAYADKDDFVSYHAKRASATLDLGRGVVEP